MVENIQIYLIHNKFYCAISPESLGRFLSRFDRFESVA